MKLVILVSAIALSGCGTLGVVAQKGADANDAALDGAEFTICEGASIGAVRRKYGSQPEKWESLCADDFTLAP